MTAAALFLFGTTVGIGFASWVHRTDRVAADLRARTAEQDRDTAVLARVAAERELAAIRKRAEVLEVRWL